MVHVVLWLEALCRVACCWVLLLSCGPQEPPCPRWHLACLGENEHTLRTDAHKTQKGEGGLSGGRKTPRRGVGQSTSLPFSAPLRGAWLRLLDLHLPPCCWSVQAVRLSRQLWEGFFNAFLPALGLSLASQRKACPVASKQQLPALLFQGSAAVGRGLAVL